MAVQDIIVLGASLGGLEAYQTIVRGLPSDLPAAVFLVQHVGSGSKGKSLLPRILNQSSNLPVLHPRDAHPIQQGHIYVAPPDRHMVLESGLIRVIHGPKENFTRPAINPLFRSAAKSFGPRVAAVILTGMLDDGVAGFAEVKRQGGVTIVQDPRTAVAPSMPEQAIRCVGSDYILPIEQIATTLAQLTVVERESERREEPMNRANTDLTCPECRGPIREERQGTIVEYRCRVGHVYSPLSYLDDQLQTVERSLASSLVALEELAEFAERLADDVPGARDEAEKRRQQAENIRVMLNNPTSEAI